MASGTQTLDGRGQAQSREAPEERAEEGLQLEPSERRAEEVVGPMAKFRWGLGAR